MSVSSPKRRTGDQRGGNGTIVAALIAVIAAILLIGYFAFVNTGQPRHGAAGATTAATGAKAAATPLPAASP